MDRNTAGRREEETMSNKTGKWLPQGRRPGVAGPTTLHEPNDPLTPFRGKNRQPERVDNGGLIEGAPAGANAAVPVATGGGR